MKREREIERGRNTWGDGEKKQQQRRGAKEEEI